MTFGNFKPSPLSPVRSLPSDDTFGVPLTSFASLPFPEISAQYLPVAFHDCALYAPTRPSVIGKETDCASTELLPRSASANVPRITIRGKLDWF